jgi:hypothetical protein
LSTANAAPGRARYRCALTRSSARTADHQSNPRSWTQNRPRSTHTPPAIPTHANWTSGEWIPATKRRLSTSGEEREGDEATGARKPRQNAPPRTYEPSRGAEHPDQRRPRRNMRRPLPSPDVRRGRLRAGRPPRRSRRASRSPAGADTTADPFRVVHGPRVRLLPFCERTHRDDVTGRGCRDRSPRGRCRCGLSGQGGMARFGTARRSERDHGRPSGSGPIASS